MASAIHLFTYGSLMFEPVWKRVVQGHYESRLACLEHHQRFALKGESYPAVVAKRGQRVHGRVYLNVQQDDVARLDAFEGSPYQRITTTVLIPEPIEASVYLFLAPDQLAQNDWDPEHFERIGLDKFITTYCAQKGV